MSDKDAKKTKKDSSCTAIPISRDAKKLVKEIQTLTDWSLRVIVDKCVREYAKQCDIKVEEDNDEHEDEIF